LSVFIDIEHDAIVQTDDKVRIDATRTFLSPGEGAITAFEIKPDADTDYQDCLENQYLDWAYSAAATATITVRVSIGATQTTKTSTISIVTAATDALWSNDQDLKAHEHDILKFLPEDRATYKYMHRRAQTLILAHLDKEGYRDINGDRYTKAAVVNTEEVKYWSTFMTLRLIFEGISNEIGDIFDKKAKDYGAKEAFYRDQAVLELDVDADGDIDDGEGEHGLQDCVVRRR
jgi:hypothetical protein